MFARGSIFIRALFALLLVALLVAGGYFIYQAGQAQGYAQGVAASGAELPSPGAPQPYYPGYPYYRPYFGFFPFFPLLCIGGLALFFLFAVGGIFRRMFWHGRGWYGRNWYTNPEDREAWESGTWGGPPWVRKHHHGDMPSGDKPSGDRPGGGPSTGKTANDAGQVI